MAPAVSSSHTDASVRRRMSIANFVNKDASGTSTSRSRSGDYRCGRCNSTMRSRAELDQHTLQVSSLHREKEP